MLTSPEILRKVLQLSRKRLKVFLFLCIFMLFKANAGNAEDTENVAVLEKGPAEQNGIELLPPNAIKAFTGIYRFKDEKMKVIYTEQALPVLSEWKPEKCFRRTLYRLPYSTLYVFYYRDKGGYELFFEFPKGFSYFCKFMDEFIAKFNIYRGFVKHKTDIPFPAVLHLDL